jgi:succinylarginine dihydrolase
MWVANSGVFSPSQDTEDGKVHITPANLVAKLHRSLEPHFTHRVFEKIFSASCFEVHPPLPAHSAYGDEGAANHERLFTAKGGVELFVWGREAFGQERSGRFVARQTDAASETIARNHRVRPAQLVFAQQSAQAIDAGAFHNDVVAVAHRNTLLFHEAAFEDTPEVLAELRQKFLAFEDAEFKAVEIPHTDLPLEKAISSYLFNSQLVTTSQGQTLLLAPIECQEDPTVRSLLEALLSTRAQPFQAVQFINLRESMKNGGGPGCLRVRVTLTDAELSQVHPGVLLNDARLDELEAWVTKHYRDRLSAADFADPKLLTEVKSALSDLEQILDLRGLYGLS